jgi:hypothetical protein
MFLCAKINYNHGEIILKLNQFEHRRLVLFQFIMSLFIL